MNEDTKDLENQYSNAPFSDKLHFMSIVTLTGQIKDLTNAVRFATLFTFLSNLTLLLIAMKFMGYIHSPAWLIITPLTFPFLVALIHTVFRKESE